jgi:hypothetical protein
MSKSDKKNGTQNGIYIYALVDCGWSDDDLGSGLFESPISTVVEGRVAAVVSHVDRLSVRPARRYLAAHDGVLKRLLETTTPLPFSFGTIARGPNALRHFLNEYEEELAAQLDRVAGKVEMGLRVSWNVPDFYSFFVDDRQELRKVRDRIYSQGKNPSTSDKIELGRLFEQCLNTAREDHAKTVMTVLEPCCSEIRQTTVRREHDVMNLACLVHKDRLDMFEAAVFEAASGFSKYFAFDFTGPWSPHNFVERMQLS